MTAVRADSNPGWSKSSDGSRVMPMRSITRCERRLLVVVNETTSSSPAAPKAVASAAFGTRTC